MLRADTELGRIIDDSKADEENQVDEESIEPLRKRTKQYNYQAGCQSVTPHRK